MTAGLRWLYAQRPSTIQVYAGSMPNDLLLFRSMLAQCPTTFYQSGLCWLYAQRPSTSQVYAGSYKAQRPPGPC